MLEWCFRMMSAEETVVIAKTNRPIEGVINSVATGNEIAAAMELAETYFVKAKQSRKMRKEIPTPIGEMYKNAPRAVATPLPPLKRSQTGKQWPRIAQRAAKHATELTFSRLP